MINAILPIQIKVLAKSSYGRYTLLLNHKKIQTRSMVELEIGAQYLAELYVQKGGLIQFKHLFKKPHFDFFQEGLELIIEILQAKFDYKTWIISNLLECKHRHRYEIFKQMLFASFENIYHIPFVFEKQTCLFQMKRGVKFLELYLYLNVFGPLKILIDKNEIVVLTPFFKVEKFLSEHLEFKVLQDKNVQPLFTLKKLSNLKG